jgi:hypothetical protein
MSDGKVNKRILEGVQENSEEDELITAFLTDLIYEEAGRAGRWWWKDDYREKVKDYSVEWEKKDED